MKWWARDKKVIVSIVRDNGHDGHGRSFREIVRQQWNFSPPETVRETEDYTVDLSDVTVLELRILPDKSGGEARASLASLRLA